MWLWAHSEKRAMSGDSIRATSPPIPTHQMSWAMAKPEVQEVFEIHAAIWGAPEAAALRCEACMQHR